MLILGFILVFVVGGVLRAIFGRFLGAGIVGAIAGFLAWTIPTILGTLACDAVTRKDAVDAVERTSVERDDGATGTSELHERGHIATHAGDAGHLRDVLAVERHGHVVRELGRAGAPRARIDQRHCHRVSVRNGSRAGADFGHLRPRADAVRQGQSTAPRS